MKYTLKRLMIGILFLCLILGLIIEPRIRRHRQIESLYDRDTWLFTSSSDFLDKWLNTQTDVSGISVEPPRGGPAYITEEKWKALILINYCEDIRLCDFKTDKSSVYPVAYELIDIDYYEDHKGKESLVYFLQHQTKATKFDFYYCSAIDDSHISSLKDNSNIKELIIIHCNVNGTGFNSLTASERSIDLKIKYCPLTEVGLFTIANCKSIKSFHLNIEEDYQILDQLFYFDSDIPIKLTIYYRTEMEYLGLKPMLAKLEGHFDSVKITCIQEDL